MHALKLGRSLVVFAIAAAAASVAGTERAAAQEAFSPFDKPRLGGNETGEDSAEATLAATLTSENPRPGGEAVLTVAAELPTGFYIYSTKPGFDARTKIEVLSSPGLEPIDDDWRADREPKTETQDALGGGVEEVEKFYGDVRWTRRFRITEDAGETASITAELNGQYCSTGTGGVCKQLRKRPLEASLTLAGADVTPKTVLKAFPHSYEERPEFRGDPYPGTVRATLTPKDAQPGEKVELAVTIDLQDGWHTYSTTQTGIGASPTVLTVAETFGLEATEDAAFEPDAKPERHRDEDLDTVLEEHHDEVTWTREFTVAEEAEAYGVRGSAKFQTCSSRSCLPAQTAAFALGTLPVEASADAAAAVDEEPRDEAVPAPVAEEQSPSDVAETANAEEPQVAETSSGAPGAKGLVAFLVMAVLAGFGALLTPCSFPMVPITVSFFLKQSEKEHRSPIALATVYALGIIGTFTVLGVLVSAIFGPQLLNQLANDAWINLGIAAVLVFFGFNLLGMFEIRIPSSLINWSSSHERQGGYVGVLFMALTFTLVSFTCTFAFVGWLLAIAFKGDYMWPTLGMLAFSTAFASPFFFLALFPSYLQKLPKSGGWMNSVKVTMGMIELGAAFKFLSVADLTVNPTRPMFFDASLVLSAWIALSICAGLYLLGLFRTTHDTPSDSISAPRMAFAMTFLGFAAYLSAGLFSPRQPDGYVWEQIDSYLPQVTEVEYASESGTDGVDDGTRDLGPVKKHDGLAFALDVDRALAVAAETGKPLFYDFTGINCANCRVMEERMKQPSTRKLLGNYVRVALYLDQVPVPDAAERERLLERNLDVALSELQDVSMPAYAVVTPEGEIMWGVEPIKGVTDIGRFNTFLEDGLKEWQRIVQAENRPNRLASR